MTNKTLEQRILEINVIAGSYPRIDTAAHNRIDWARKEVAKEALEIINELRAQNEWQPIETAPKDGTNILLYIEEVAIQGIYDDGWGTITLPEHGCGCCASKNDEPTHWQPLPKPPTKN